MPGRMITRVLLQCFLLVAVARPEEEVFNTTPSPVRTNFSCLGRQTGFYADVEANCKVYHTCDDHGNKFSYRCPEETAFRQDALICDHAHLVDCHGGSPNYNEAQGREAKALGSSGAGNPTLTDSTSLSQASTNDRRSYSRSFKVIQPRDESSGLDNSRPGFVFTASVFLRDRNNPQEDHRVHPTVRQTNSNFGLVDASKVNRPFTKTTFNGVLACESGNREFLEDTRKNDVVASFSTARPIFINRFDPTSGLNVDESGQRNLHGREGRPFVANDRLDTDRFKIYPTIANRNVMEEPSGLNRGTRRREDLPTTFQARFSTAQFEDTTLSTGSGLREFSSDVPRTRLNHPYNNRDYPYLETLRSIQANSRPTSPVTSSSGSGRFNVPTTNHKLPSRPPVTTEIPVHALTMSLKPLVPNELEYDPYYPKLPTTSEAYYTQSHHRSKGQQVPFRFSTQAPSWSNVDFAIPSVLPDLNSLEDLVDRRKLFYIPRIKAST